MFPPLSTETKTHGIRLQADRQLPLDEDVERELEPRNTLALGRVQGCASPRGKEDE